MPYATNEGVRIYYEIEGNGPPIVLMHGHGMGITVFREAGYVAGLRDDYRLILVDLRGHGKSDKVYDPDGFALATLMNDVLAVMDDAGVAKAHYLGHSGAASVGYRLAAHAGERFYSMTLGSYSPFVGDDELRLASGMKAITRGGIGRLVAALESAEPLSAAVKAHMFTNDPAVLIAAAEGGSRWLAQDHLLSAIALPCLMYAGDSDPHYEGARKAASYIPRATFVTLPGIGHLGAFLRSELVLPHVRAFLAGLACPA